MLTRLLIVATVLLAVCAPAARAANGVNTGKSGSRCAASVLNATSSTTGDGLDRTSLGSAAPAAYQIGYPTDAADAFRVPRRAMMLIHGGAWFTVGQGTLDAEQKSADRWRAAGWETLVIDYRACGQSSADANTFYELLRAKVGPDVPICIQGESAGGHLALLIAEQHADVSCVIAFGAPTDLRRIARQGKREESSGKGIKGLRNGSNLIHGLAAAAFGKRNLAAVSPRDDAGAITARVLLASAAADPYVPAAQGQSMAGAILAAHPDGYADVARLEQGDNDWVHAQISDAAQTDLQARVAAVVAPFGSPPTDATTPVLAPWAFFTRPLRSR